MSDRRLFSPTGRIPLILYTLLLLATPLSSAFSSEDPALAEARRRMVERDLRGRDIRAPKVLEILGRVPRHLFVDSSQWNKAYADYPLPIGEDQTISQPYIVALMTEILEPKDSDRVLEVGVGSGYQAAVLAELVAQVFTMDRVGPLATRAQEMLKSMGYRNIEVRFGDGTLGWPEEAPFDGIMVTAAAPLVPRPLT